MVTRVCERRGFQAEELRRTEDGAEADTTTRLREGLYRCFGAWYCARKPPTHAVHLNSVQMELGNGTETVPQRTVLWGHERLVAVGRQTMAADDFRKIEDVCNHVARTRGRRGSSKSVVPTDCMCFLIKMTASRFPSQ